MQWSFNMFFINMSYTWKHEISIHRICPQLVSKHSVVNFRTQSTEKPRRFHFRKLSIQDRHGCLREKKSQALDMWVSMGTKSVKIKNHKRSAKGSQWTGVLGSSFRHSFLRESDFLDSSFEALLIFLPKSRGLRCPIFPECSGVQICAVCDFLRRKRCKTQTLAVFW